MARNNESTKSAKSSKRKTARGGWRTAKGSDRHELYELSVQEPSAEIAIPIRFLAKIFPAQDC